nr:uncharacterized protein LOC129394517 [Pan paniscus]
MARVGCCPPQEQVFFPTFCPFPPLSFPTFLLSHPSPFPTSSHLFLPSPSSSSPLLLPYCGLPASSSAVSLLSSSRTFFSPAVFFPLPHRFLPLSLSHSSQHGFLWRQLFLPSPFLHPLASSLHLPAYSPSSVFPPLPLLPSPSSPSSPGLLPPTVFFLTPHPFLPHPAPFSSHVCLSLLPTLFSSPHRLLPTLFSSPNRLLSQPLILHFLVASISPFSQQRLPAALFSPLTIFSSSSPPSSPHALFSHCLLPAPSPQPFSPPFSSPHTVFFPCSPTVSQQRLAVAIFFPLSLPLPIVFFPQPLILRHLLPLPTFSQQRLPAAFFSPRTLFSPLPLPTVFAPDRLLAHPLLALSNCLSPRSAPRVRAPVSLRLVCLCAQAAP